MAVEQRSRRLPPVAVGSCASGAAPSSGDALGGASLTDALPCLTALPTANLPASPTGRISFSRPPLVLLLPGRRSQGKPVVTLQADWAGAAAGALGPCCQPRGGRSAEQARLGPPCSVFPAVGWLVASVPALSPHEPRSPSRPSLARFIFLSLPRGTDHARTERSWWGTAQAESAAHPLQLGTGEQPPEIPPRGGLNLRRHRVKPPVPRGESPSARRLAAGSRPLGGERSCPAFPVPCRS